MYNYRMTVSKLFINGCSFLTFRPKDNVHTHCGLELAKLIGDLLNKPVHVGPKGKNPLHALSKIEIIPKRYQQTFGEYKYTDLMYGIKKVINSAEEQLNLYK